MDFLQSFRQSKPKVQQFICKADLSKKKAASLKVKKKVHFESKPLIQNHRSKRNTETGNVKEGEVDEGEPAVQVKILMTKEEATRLLSKCKVGGILEFEDVANALAHALSANKKDS